MDFSFSFTLNEQDYFEYNKYHLYNTPALKKRLLIARFGLSAFFIIFGIVYGKILEIFGISLVVFGLLALLWIIFFRSIQSRQIKRNLKVMKKAGKLHYDKEISLHFQDECFTEATPDSEAKIKYSMLERVAVGDTDIYLYTGAAMAYIVPCRAFKDIGEKDAFLTFIASKTM